MPGTHNCPRDGFEMTLESVYPTNPVGQIPPNAMPYPALVCTGCGYTIPWAALLEHARREAEPLWHAQRRVQVLAILTFAFFVMLTFLYGTILTLMGGVLGALMLFIKSLRLRYSYWLRRNRIPGKISALALIREWLRAEIAGKVR